ncbi:similar to Saccharomyces cerevisiae YPR105C COG4 Essential component of the conserved oligomeric Golgi complex (Cog1p through Cog8p) [Maudiozyma barnettii]|nr:similar to Saccharomyces cerevisiae YPR105C COG4 Essential component of the conserved oligomeric Golgi complex (Cog1p through Cog8p) [Kazachstania barnettii]
MASSNNNTRNESQRTRDISDDQLSKNLAKYSLVLEKLTTQSQISKLVNIITQDHKNTTESLNGYIEESQLKYNKELRKFELNRVDLTTTLSDFQSTLSQITSSNNSAKRIYSDINTTDQEYKYLNKTLTFLNDVRTLKNNIILINSALEDSNYITAAKAINEIRELPPHIITSEFSKSVVPSAELPTEPQELINDWCEKLTNIFRTQFEKAVENKDIEQLTIFFKLFPLIGQSQLGLEIYSKYICEIISSENKKIVEGAIKYNAGFNTVILQLFKTVSMVINEHSKIISTCYGTQYLTIIMEKIEKETELQAILVLNYFSEKRKPAELIKQFNNEDAEEESEDDQDDYNDNDDSEYDSDSDIQKENERQIIPLNELDNLINEYSQILQNWSMYTRLFSVKWVEFSKNKSLNDPLLLPDPIINGNFLSKLHKEHHIANFQLLLFRFLNDSFAKIITLEEMPSLNDFITLEVVNHKDQSSWPISSVLEDMTLLIRKSLIYSLNTGNIIIFANFLDKLVVFVQNEFLVKFTQAKFKLLQAKLPSQSSTSFIALRRYIPKSVTDGTDSILGSRNGTPTAERREYSPQNASKLAQLSKFDFRNAFANIQSNLQSVVISEDSSDSSSILALHHFLIYINTLFFTKFSLKLLLTTEILEKNPRLLQDNFPFNDDAFIITEKIEKCQGIMLTQITKLSSWSVKVLFEKVLSSRLRLLFAHLFVNDNKTDDYKRGDEGDSDDSKCYISNIENFEDLSNLNEFINKWTTLIQPFKNVLHDDAFDRLLKSVAVYSSKVVEKKIWSLQVNELGAIRLDRELSLFINTICGTNYSLRETFVRCSQIVLLLGFDDDDFDIQSGDIKDEISSSMDWVLKPQERVNARNLMVDKRR